MTDQYVYKFFVPGFFIGENPLVAFVCVKYNLHFLGIKAWISSDKKINSALCTGGEKIIESV